MTLIAIDPHAGNDRGPQEIEGFEAHAAADHDVFRQNLEQRRRRRRRFAISGSSPHEALADVPDGIDLLYIDGAHRFGPALDDIRHWGGKVAPSGTLLIHDSFSAVGVTGALVAELFFGSDFRYLGRSGSMTHTAGRRSRWSSACATRPGKRSSCHGSCATSSSRR